MRSRMQVCGAGSVGWTPEADNPARTEVLPGCLGRRRVGIIKRTCICFRSIIFVELGGLT
jgi:hypothetical protein